MSDDPALVRKASVELPLYRNPGFVLLVAGQVVSFVGSQAQGLAVPLVVVALTRSSTAASLVLALNAVAYRAVGLFAGTLADRHDRKAIMVLSDLGRVAATMAIPIMLWHRWPTLPIVVAEIAAIAAIEPIVDPVFTVAVASYTALAAPDDLRGRVNGPGQLLVGGVAPMGLLLAGGLAEAIGVRATAACFGGRLVLLAVISTASATLRRAGRHVAVIARLRPGPHPVVGLPGVPGRRSRARARAEGTLSRWLQATRGHRQDRS